MKKGTKKPSTTARKTRQFNLSDTELDSIYELADLPKQVSKGEALRTVLRNYKDQIAENNNLKQHLKQLQQPDLTTRSYDPNWDGNRERQQEFFDKLNPTKS